MKIERLLKLAGYSKEQIAESLAKYAEPKATHAKKTGGKEVKSKEGKLKTTDKGKYAEPKAGKGPKKVKEVKSKEGKLKVPSTSKYKDHNSTK